MLELVQKYMPNRFKSFLKPFFRYIFPNKLMASIWITFRCTYKCSYCPYCGTADFTQTFPLSCEKNGEEWIAALKKLPPTSFYIQGGEPFLFKDLPYIINNLPAQHTLIGVISNASLPLSVYQQVKKKIHLNISYHREFVKEEDAFIEKVLELKKLFQVSVNIVATPENFGFIKNKLKIFDMNKIPYHIDPLILNANHHFEYDEEYKKILKKNMAFDRFNNIKLDSEKTQQKLCSAGRNYYNIVPNGDAYVCSRAIDYWFNPLVERNCDKNFLLGNIFTGTFALKEKDILCSYQCVNHCDWDYAKIKLLK